MWRYIKYALKIKLYKLKPFIEKRPLKYYSMRNKESFNGFEKEIIIKQFKKIK